MSSALDFFCKGHQVHISCLEHWIRACGSVLCPVCNANMDAFVERQLREPLEADDLNGFKLIVEKFKFYNLSAQVRVAIQYSACNILKYLKYSEYELYSCYKLYPTFLENPNYTTVQWLLGQFRGLLGEMPSRDQLIEFLIRNFRYMELFNIYHFCFSSLTRTEQIRLGRYLSDLLMIFDVFKFKTRYKLFRSISSNNHDHSRYIFTELLPICLSSPCFPPSSKCPNCGSIHSFDTIIGAIYWGNLYHLHYFLKCFFQKDYVFSSDQLKDLALTISHSPFKDEILDLLHVFPQFSKRLTWRLTLMQVRFMQS